MSKTKVDRGTQMSSTGTAMAEEIKTQAAQWQAAESGREKVWWAVSTSHLDR
jgi:hypothetical protein